MMIRPPSKRRLAVLAAACLVSVAVPLTPAWAEKTKTKPAVTAQAMVPPEVTVEIPTITMEGSNVDEDTLRAIFSGNIVDNAEALAGLTADSIGIPAITIHITSTVDGEQAEATATIIDLALSEVSNGVAGAVTMAGVSLDAGDQGSGEFGELSANSVNLAAMLSMYGLVPAADANGFATIYKDFRFAGGSFTSPEVTCDFGEMTAAEFKARPLKTSLMEMMTLASALESQGDKPSPELMGKIVHMYADIFSAFESSPVHYDGLSCDGTDDNDEPVQITIASIDVDGMSPGTYPGVSVDGIDILAGEDGAVSLGNFTFKPMDISGPIATVQAAPAELDEAWFAANARALIPAFAGFSFSDVAVDVPDPEAEAARIVASIASFDLSLGNYRNGIPATVSTNASHIMLDLPTDTNDEQLQMLLALGVTSIDAGFTVDAGWDEATNTIKVNDISVTGADLATVKLAGTIANATEALFSTDENAAMMAAMGVAISNLKLDVTDMGLSDLVLSIASQDQGSDAATLRTVYSGLAEGTIVSMLAGAAEAQKVGAAVSAFVSGKAKQLSIDLTAKQPPGLGMMDFMAAEEDPTVLIGKVNISATAK
ncbi:hypothetical protein [Devosia aquimaris]|uniref:hypothetical protein n=1 Tax=Devosia aquimaris TaxID=2866214 RepID=UPI001CD15EE1|nr:hypothetical protein [Devosia sp. CJK-A8-3]